jgi:divalent metal cation (Fe/Co/Zn/Cd) transporter
MEGANEFLTALTRFAKEWPKATEIIYIAIVIGLVSVIVNKIIVPLRRRNGKGSNGED